MTKPADGGKRLPRRRTIEEMVKETETEGDKEEEYKEEGSTRGRDEEEERMEYVEKP